MTKNNGLLWFRDETHSVVCHVVDETGMIHRFDVKPETPEPVLAPIPDIPLEEINPNQSQRNDEENHMQPSERAELEQERKRMWEAIGSLQIKVNATMKGMEEKIATINERLTEVSAQLTELDKRVSRVVQSTIKNLEGAEAKVQECCLELVTQMAPLADKVGALVLDSDKRKADIHALSSRLNKIEAEYFPQVPKTKNALVDLANGIEGLNRNMRMIYNRVGALEASHTKMGTEIKDLDDKVLVKITHTKPKQRPEPELDSLNIHTTQYAFVSRGSDKTKQIMHTRKLSDGEIKELAGYGPGSTAEVDRLDRCPVCEAWTTTADSGGKELWKSLDCPAVQAELAWEEQKRRRLTEVSAQLQEAISMWAARIENAMRVLSALPVSELSRKLAEMVVVESVETTTTTKPRQQTP